MTATTTDRRFDLDWLRIGAFALLILYHVGMFYVTWDWHVKSSRASEAIEPIMMFVNPWRLTLLFIISGVATRFMADKMAPGPLAWARLGRLFPPLLLAVFLIVPPQSYYEIVEALRAMPAEVAAQYPTALDHFYQKYATASGNWCDADGCLITPTYNHMWFVAYLVIYTLVLIALSPLLRRLPKALGFLIAGPGLILAPWLLMSALRISLFPAFDITHALVDDWYAHALYFGAFAFGFAIAKHEAFFSGCERWRYLAVVLTCAAWAGLMAYYADPREPSELVRNIFRSVHELQAWTAIIALFGFASRYLRNADGPIRRTLTIAIFPFYLVHQTIIVVAGHYLDPLQWPLWIEASVLIGLTVLGCVAAFALALAVPPLRIWLGVPSKPKQFRGKNIEFAVRGTN